MQDRASGRHCDHHRASLHGPTGGTVLALSVARKQFRSGCLYGPGPLYAVVGTNQADRIIGTTCQSEFSDSAVKIGLPARAGKTASTAALRTIGSGPATATPVSTAAAAATGSRSRTETPVSTAEAPETATIGSTEERATT